MSPPGRPKGEHRSAQREGTPLTVTVRQALAQSGLVPVDAQVLLAHALHRDRAWLAAHGDDILSREQAEMFFAVAKRRRDGEPVAYLTGSREFWGLALAVTRDVLIPRPETETLVELALDMAAARPAGARARSRHGVGRHCAGARERAAAGRIVATDTSAAALEVARANAQRLALSNVEFVLANWYDGIADAGWDMIVSNPPYVAMGDPHLTEGDLRFEPSGALASGVDGLAALRTIVAGAPARLAPGGALIVEHGFDQSAAVQGLLRGAGFDAITVRRDLAGIARVAEVKRRDRAASATAGSGDPCGAGERLTRYPARLKPCPQAVGGRTDWCAADVSARRPASPRAAFPPTVATTA